MGQAALSTTRMHTPSQMPLAQWDYMLKVGRAGELGPSPEAPLQLGWLPTLPPSATLGGAYSSQIAPSSQGKCEVPPVQLHASPLLPHAPGDGQSSLLVPLLPNKPAGAVSYTGLLFPCLPAGEHRHPSHCSQHCHTAQPEVAKLGPPRAARIKSLTSQQSFLWVSYWTLGLCTCTEPSPGSAALQHTCPARGGGLQLGLLAMETCAYAAAQRSVEECAAPQRSMCACGGARMSMHEHGCPFLGSTFSFFASVSSSAILAHFCQKLGSSKEMSVLFPEATKLAWG